MCISAILVSDSRILRDGIEYPTSEDTRNLNMLSYENKTTPKVADMSFCIWHSYEFQHFFITFREKSTSRVNARVQQVQISKYSKVNINLQIMRIRFIAEN